MRKKILFPLIGLIFFGACNSKKKIENNTIEKSKYYPRIDIKNCITARDSFWANGNHLAYIQVDSLIGIEVRFNGVTDTMDFFFSCDFPNISIPKLFTYTQNELLVKQAAGQSFSQITVISLNENKKIIYTTYETNLVDMNAKRAFSYKISYGDDSLHLYDVWGGRTSVVRLPKGLQRLRIKEIELYKDSMLLFFENGKQTALSYPKGW